MSKPLVVKPEIMYGTLANFRHMAAAVDPGHSVFTGDYVSWKGRAPDRYQVAKCIVNNKLVGACIEQYEPAAEFVVKGVIKTTLVSFIDIAVLEECRGRGIAEQLVRALPASEIATRLWICRKTNLASIRTAVKLGCTPLVVKPTELFGASHTDNARWRELKDLYECFVLPSF